MKKLSLLFLLSISLFIAKAQDLFIVRDSVVSFDCAGSLTFYKLIKVKRFVKTPAVFQDTLKISMYDFFHNILIARVENAILHYNVNSGDLDTLFFVYPNTQIFKPLWSPKKDKIAFLIYNPQKQYNYTTPYRLILITLQNGKVIKKEKKNIENIPGCEYYVEFQDFEQLLPNRCFKFTDDNKIEILGSKEILTFSNVSGFEPIDEEKNYELIIKNGQYHIVEYQKTNAPVLTKSECCFYNYFRLKNNLLFYYDLTTKRLTIYDAKTDRILKELNLGKLYSDFMFSEDGRYVAFVSRNGQDYSIAYPTVINCKNFQMHIYNDKPLKLAPADDYYFVGSMKFVKQDGLTKLVVDNKVYLNDKGVHYEIPLE